MLELFTLFIGLWPSQSPPLSTTGHLRKIWENGNLMVCGCRHTLEGVITLARRVWTDGWEKMFFSHCTSFPYWFRLLSEPADGCLLNFPKTSLTFSSICFFYLSRSWGCSASCHVSQKATNLWKSEKVDLWLNRSVIVLAAWICRWLSDHVSKRCVIRRCAGMNSPEALQRAFM